jgi:hypothetical protein
MIPSTEVSKRPGQRSSLELAHADLMFAYQRLKAAKSYLIDSSVQLRPQNTALAHDRIRSALSHLYVYEPARPLHEARWLESSLKKSPGPTLNQQRWLVWRALTLLRFRLFGLPESE